MSGFDLNLLRPLDALLRLRNVTEAARQLDISQPTMSGMLARLREQLHDPLLVRVGKSFELTPRAADLLTEVRQALLHLEHLVAPQTVFNPAALKRHFSIMVSEFGLFLALPQVFREAARIAPEVTFSVLAIDRPVASVYSGSIDLCLTGDSIAEVAGEVANAVRTQQLMDDVLVGVVDVAHPLRGAISLEQYLSFAHVATQFPNSPWMVEDLGIKGLSERRPPRVRVASFMAIGQMVIGTQDIGAVPGRLARFMCADPRLRMLDLPAEFAGIAIRALWHIRYDQDPAHRWLRSLLADACAAQNSLQET